MKIAEQKTYSDRHGIGKGYQTKSIILNKKEDAKKLKKELEHGDNIEKLAEVLNIEIQEKIEFGDTKPKKTIPEKLKNYQEVNGKWYDSDGERIAHLTNQPLNNGHRTTLNIEEEFLEKMYPEKTVLTVIEWTSYNGINPNSRGVKFKIKG